MPEYRIKVSVSVVPYPELYSSSLESSHHEFFIEAESAAVAVSKAREQFLVTRDFITADTHDRDEKERMNIRTAAGG